MFVVNAKRPTAVLLAPVVEAVNASLPIATLLPPVVYASPAPAPILVLFNESLTSILPVQNVATPATPIVTPVPTKN